MWGGEERRGERYVVHLIRRRRHEKKGPRERERERESADRPRKVSGPDCHQGIVVVGIAVVDGRRRAEERVDGRAAGGSIRFGLQG